MSGLVGIPPISVSPSECLFGRFQLDLGFRLKMISRIRSNTLPSVLAGGGVYFPMGLFVT